ncbi:MAG: hypothetical protein PHG83_04300 [Patescibacteria group bacterium]|nr:hypothetical protein [Patescibacteria group bacterium]
MKKIFVKEIESFTHKNVVFKLLELEIPKNEVNRYVIFLELNNEKHFLPAGDYITAQKILSAIKIDDAELVKKLCANTTKDYRYEGYNLVLN